MPAESFRRRTILLHLSGWLGYGLLHLYWFSLSTDLGSAAVLTARILVLDPILFYLNVGVLLPWLIGRNRYFSYLLCALGLLVGSIYLYDLSGHLPSIHAALETLRPHFRLRRAGPMPRRSLASRWFWGTLLSPLAILFFSSTYWMISESRRSRQRELSLHNENLDSELRFLKSQIQPHFLFNALNNLYSLALMQSDKTPGMLMKLSDMLRYMLDEQPERRVSLAQEIAYIRNFIDFQLLKIEGPPHLDLDLSPADPALRLEPMILMPFIENAFKHGNIEDLEHGWISIRLSSDGSRILFSVGNTLPSCAERPLSGPGIGLANVKKRLGLLYPATHQLEIQQHNGSFWVHLTLDTAP